MASNVVQYVRQQVRTSLQDMTRYFREKKNESLWFQLSSHETEEKKYTAPKVNPSHIKCIYFIFYSRPISACSVDNSIVIIIENNIHSALEVYIANNIVSILVWQKITKI